MRRIAACPRVARGEETAPAAVEETAPAGNAVPEPATSTVVPAPELVASADGPISSRRADSQV
jgi:hypothetical protein